MNNTNPDIVTGYIHAQTKNMNPLMNLSEIELRDLCRHNIEAFEQWSRRFIDETLKSYDIDYLDFMVSDGCPLVKNEIKNRIKQRVKDNPDRFPRMIDAILIEDIEYFLCRDDLYKRHFKPILEPFYSGVAEIRNVMNKLISIRNKLSHCNTISIHEAEQCLCYTDEFIEIYKQYYLTIGKEKIYNVPTFFRIKDCFGHDIIRGDSSYSWTVMSHVHMGNLQLHSKQAYKLWVEVDGSFDSSFYELTWEIQRSSKTIYKGHGNVIEFSPTNNDVSYLLQIIITLTTKRDWHRFQTVDDIVEIHFDEVLPPIEDTY